MTPAAEGGTAKVGLYEPNAWGLYDMLGSVYEWCLDWYQMSPLGFDPLTGPVSGQYRVERGGGNGSVAWPCRSARRGGVEGKKYDIGCRVALPLPAGLPND